MSLASELYATIKQRKRPKDVVRLILKSDSLSASERTLLERAASRRSSSMRDEFRQAVIPERQVRSLERAFAMRPISECDDAALLDDLLERAAKKIKAKSSALDFKNDRMNRKDRKKAGLGKLSKRQYNRRFRLLRRFNDKIGTYRGQIAICDALMVAKSGLATRIKQRQFTADPAAAMFIAYHVARMNRRSMFTNVGQESAFDQVGNMLLGRVTKGWFAVAHAFPDRRVVDHLTPKHKTALMLMALDELRKLSVMLGKTWEGTKFDRAAMIVKKGDDSSTWNALAGAWNVVRTSYFAMLYALGAEHLIESVCPGKVMRLMAADVAYWHRASGGDLDPNTAVWAQLPAPWEVLSGAASCTAADVMKVCKVRGIDPYATGWLPRVREAHAVAFRPTPELVHGVAVSTPELAKILRKAGWFSGKGGSGVGGVEVERDEHGFAVKAKHG